MSSGFFENSSLITHQFCSSNLSYSRLENNIDDFPFRSTDCLVNIFDWRIVRSPFLLFCVRIFIRLSGNFHRFVAISMFSWRRTLYCKLIATTTTTADVVKLFSWILSELVERELAFVTMAEWMSTLQIQTGCGIFFENKFWLDGIR